MFLWGTDINTVARLKNFFSAGNTSLCNDFRTYSAQISCMVRQISIRRVMDGSFAEISCNGMMWLCFPPHIWNPQFFKYIQELSACIRTSSVISQGGGVRLPAQTQQQICKDDYMSLGVALTVSWFWLIFVEITQRATVVIACVSHKALQSW